MSERKHITLVELQTALKRKLEEAVPLPFWVTAEVSELNVNSSGHCYLELVEKGGGKLPKARVAAVVWRSTWGALRPYFASATGSELGAGMSILVRATVSYHELYGLSLVISDIDPTYTLGDMERQRQQTVQRLQDEGVFDMNREVGLPDVMQRVAVVSSPNAAGYQDFMNELAASSYRFETELFEAVMQGAGAEDSLIAALERIAARAEEFDVTVIVRGGGSQSDLAAFDSYRLASHVAQFPLSVATGIGHDKDQSVADLVARISFKTPTAVATWLVAGLAEFEALLDDFQEDVTHDAIAILDEQRARVRGCAMALAQVTGGFARTIEVRLERLAGDLRRRQDALLFARRTRLDALSATLRERVAGYLSRAGARLELAAAATRNRTPDAILSLGFAIVRRGGVAVTDAATLSSGDRLDVTFAVGRATAEVKNIEEHGK
ncbi:MAG: exodeoxyribonuclease VII large subunit [Rikenellaceae bacterium]|nr:exodeoxyribonuclease VII large subunit [Rikenellaceae bacterium]MCL2693255.1 exodeoxyribonuclease VII large subunit [Rikenellaceae bacterium]